jgi:hypothetical protein
MMTKQGLGAAASQKVLIIEKIETERPKIKKLRRRLTA